MPLHTGLSIAEQPEEFSYSQRNGGISTRIWRGVYSSLETIASQLKSAGWNYTLKRGMGDIWTLTGTLGGDEDGSGGIGANQEATDTWELLSNKVEKDLLETDDPLITALSSDEIGQIRHFINNPPDDATSPAFTNPTDQLPVYNLMQSGVKSVPIESAILRHTKIVPRNQPSVIDYGNTGKIFTVAQLRGKEGCPPDFLIPLDQFDSGSITTSNIAKRWGWKKNLPTLQLTNFSRREVHLEYEFGLWPTDLFDAAT